MFFGRLRLLKIVRLPKVKVLAGRTLGSTTIISPFYRLIPFFMANPTESHTRTGRRSRNLATGTTERQNFQRGHREPDRGIDWLIHRSAPCRYAVSVRVLKHAGPLLGETG